MHRSQRLILVKQEGVSRLSYTKGCLINSACLICHTLQIQIPILKVTYQLFIEIKLLNKFD